ncbi:hypothetical protein ACHAWF_011774 [Thalassiosira exigua]
MSYKEQKEAFVTGHEGTTPFEVLLVCLSGPVGVACFQQVAARGAPSFRKSILLEAALVWFPMVLCQTKFLHPYGVALMAFQTTAAAILKRMNKTNETATTSTDAPPKKLDYVTICRSLILYLTFVAILAVDFRVFPRRFAKTEVAGYGLMDVGAASFCASAGLVSRVARGGESRARNGWNGKQLAHTLPLVALGALRIVVNKELEYQEHVSEYGVHWNFFFTMGVMAVVPPFLPGRGTWALPVALVGLYQTSLSFWGVQEYIESAPRTCGDGSSGICVPFFAANREGILGCIGYISIYLAGEYVGLRFVWQRKSLWSITITAWVLFGILAQCLTASRRSTNATFCLWAIAHNLVILAIVQTLDRCGKVPIVFEMVNKHGSPMFLIANLLVVRLAVRLEPSSLCESTGNLTFFCAPFAGAGEFDYTNSRDWRLASIDDCVWLHMSCWNDSDDVGHCDLYSCRWPARQRGENGLNDQSRWRHETPPIGPKHLR